MNDLRTRLEGALVMGPMTKGSNLPYRRLCSELGARITMGEMALTRKLVKGSRSEFALVRRAPSEVFFGVQLAGRDPEELAWSSKLAEERGADLVDLNLGCPIHDMTRRGLGAALLRRPKKVGELVAAMKGAVRSIPVTVKIRLGWDERHRNHVHVAQSAVAAGADAVVVHGRTRLQRYRRAADWDAVSEVVEAVDVPVVGNGDVLFPHEIDAARRTSGCAAVMTARGCLIKPWIFCEAEIGYMDVTAEERLAIYRRYVELAREHWGEDERGLGRVREFALWHFDFWHRYVPRHPNGEWPRLQEREMTFCWRSPLEELLSRSEAEVHSWLVDALIDGREVDPAAAPSPRQDGPAGWCEVVVDAGQEITWSARSSQSSKRGAASSGKADLTASV